LAAPGDCSCWGTSGHHRLLRGHDDLSSSTGVLRPAHGRMRMRVDAGWDRPSREGHHGKRKIFTSDAMSARKLDYTSVQHGTVKREMTTACLRRPGHKGLQPWYRPRLTPLAPPLQNRLNMINLMSLLILRKTICNKLVQNSIYCFHSYLRHCLTA